VKLPGEMRPIGKKRRALVESAGSCIGACADTTAGARTSPFRSLEDQFNALANEFRRAVTRHCVGMLINLA
jgi:hypothetical protein